MIASYVCVLRLSDAVGVCGDATCPCEAARDEPLDDEQEARLAWWWYALAGERGEG